MEPIHPRVSVPPGSRAALGRSRHVLFPDSQDALRTLLLRMLQSVLTLSRVASAVSIFVAVGVITAVPRLRWPVCALSHSLRSHA